LCLVTDTLQSIGRGDSSRVGVVSSSVFFEIFLFGAAAQHGL
jgi:hypothetical protein